MEAQATSEPKGAAQAPKSAKMWLDRIKEAETKFQKWHDQCQNLDRLYSRNERADNTDREYSLFWANIEVLKPAVYARSPVPVVAPRFKDGNAVAREASEILERSLIVSFEQGDIDGLMREVRDEFLRYARGTAWVRLSGNDDEIAYDWVSRKDFLHGPARNWREVPWVARRHWIDREKGVQRFGGQFNTVELKKRDPNAAIPDKEDQAPVWEIWCKQSQAVYWVAEGSPDILDEKPPLYALRDFWPCPKPAYGTVVPDTLVPVPDIRQYKDQIEEINEYTARIAALSEALKLKGFYQAGSGDLSQAVEAAVKSTDNRAILVPISSQAAFGPGGLKDAIVWLPVDQVANLITSLVDLRRVVIDDVYQIMGISDIIRGSSDPKETLGAQQLKSQWGSIRIRERQNELARFARDVTRIAAEIMAENFAPDVLFEMAQAQLPTMQAKQQAQLQIQQQEQMAQQQAMMAQQQGQPAQPQQAPEIPKEVQKMLKQPSREEVAQFLANDRARGFVIEIETDSTIQPDEDAEKQRRVEFVTSIGGLVQQAVPAMQAAPQFAPLLGEVMKFAAAGFRAGRPLEAAIDQFVEQLEGVAEQANQPAPPDPVQETKLKIEETKLEGVHAQTEATKVQAQATIATTQQKMEQSQQQHQQNMEAMAASTAMAQRETPRGR